MSRPHLVIESLAEQPVSSRRLELVERKGIGHPDTMCDALVEAVAVALNRMYVERLGATAHYNIDKALLIAGQCRKDFGGGTVTQPMELVIGDRATFTVDDRQLAVVRALILERAAVNPLASWAHWLAHCQRATDRERPRYSESQALGTRHQVAAQGVRALACGPITPSGAARSHVERAIAVTTVTLAAEWTTP